VVKPGGRKLRERGPRKGRNRMKARGSRGRETRCKPVSWDASERDNHASQQLDSEFANRDRRWDTLSKILIQDDAPPVARELWARAVESKKTAEIMSAEILRVKKGQVHWIRT
jgi:hypothetical protein